MSLFRPASRLSLTRPRPRPLSLSPSLHHRQQKHLPHRHLTTSSPSPSSSFPKIAVLIERRPEPEKRHKPGGYHPLAPGDLLNGRYRVFHQLGWGLYSTVWLVRDIREKKLFAVKIQIGDLTTYTGPQDEQRTLSTLLRTNPSSAGHPHICHLRDTFEVHGPRGTHVCLVLDPMRVSVFDIWKGFQLVLPMDLLRRVARDVLLALRYVHEECGIVHTDIKGDNIMLASMPPESDRKTLDIGIDELLRLPYALSDFGSAVKPSERSSGLIQPVDLRAPEVIVEAVWDTKADIWNFGCLMYELARGSKLFDPSHHHDKYKEEEGGSPLTLTPAQIHLSQIVAMLGEFPRSLLERAERAMNYFDERGRLLVTHNSSDKEKAQQTSLSTLVASSGHPLRDVPDFLDFLSKALVIEPRERWSAGMLLGHRWLGSEGEGGGEA